MDFMLICIVLHRPVRGLPGAGTMCTDTAWHVFYWGVGCWGIVAGSAGVQVVSILCMVCMVKCGASGRSFLIGCGDTTSVKLTV